MSIYARINAIRGSQIPRATPQQVCRAHSNLKITATDLFPSWLPSSKITLNERNYTVRPCIIIYIYIYTHIYIYICLYAAPNSAYLRSSVKAAWNSVEQLLLPQREHPPPRFFKCTKSLLVTWGFGRSLKWRGQRATD